MKNSIWQTMCKAKEYGVFKDDEKKDVVVIGGGMAGMLCAFLLLKAGVNNVAVIEGDRIGSGTTGFTTAKITAQHNLIYDKLLSVAGRETAEGYAAANLKAIEAYGEIIAKNGIDCNFERQDAYLYTVNEKYEDELMREAKAASELGIDAAYEHKAALPFPVFGALRFSNQAQFNPLKFLYSLADIVVSMGGDIWENTRALSLEDNDVITDRGKVSADHIVICSHFPLWNKSGMYFMKLFQSRSYVLALENVKYPGGMYLDIETGGLSLRSALRGNERLLLLGGAGHKTGHEGDIRHYARLKEEASLYFPGSIPVAEWSTQDVMTHDSIPYAGRHSNKHGSLYVATGFNKWGMTSSMVSAKIITEQITGKRSEYEEIFSPSRKDINLMAGSFVKETADIVADVAEGFFAGEDENGICPRCTHMGGALHWNEDECSYDCRAHGSRFDKEGNVLNNPAVNTLKKD